MLLFAGWFQTLCHSGFVTNCHFTFFLTAKTGVKNDLSHEFNPLKVA
jgi:hypothetical protein